MACSLREAGKQSAVSVSATPSSGIGLCLSICFQTHPSLSASAISAIRPWSQNFFLMIENMISNTCRWQEKSLYNQHKELFAKLLFTLFLFLKQDNKKNKYKGSPNNSLTRIISEKWYFTRKTEKLSSSTTGTPPNGTPRSTVLCVEFKHVALSMKYKRLVLFGNSHHREAINGVEPVGCL